MVLTGRKFGLEHLERHDVDEEDPDRGVQQLLLVLHEADADHALRLQPEQKNIYTSHRPINIQYVKSKASHWLKQRLESRAALTQRSSC